MFILSAEGSWEEGERGGGGGRGRGGGGGGGCHS